MTIAAAEAKRRADKKGKEDNGKPKGNGGQAKSQGSKPGASVLRTKDGKAYVIDIESGQAYLLENETMESGATFAGTETEMANTIFDFNNLCATVAHLDVDHVSSAIELCHATATHYPRQLNIPWFLDTAASVHISEVKSDFSSI